MRKPDFETVYETYYDKLYRYAYGLLLHPEDAEDVVEETFFAAYQGDRGALRHRIQDGQQALSAAACEVPRPAGRRIKIFLKKCLQAAINLVYSIEQANA